MRIGDFPLSVGTYCELWGGVWNRGGREEASREKVSLRLTTFILLTLRFVGGLENTSSAQAIEEGV